MTSPSWVTNLTLILLATLLFGAGFYFGYKNGSFSKPTNELSIINSSASKITTDDKTLESQKVEPELGVFWIKAGTEPICPKDHPIKGTFDDNSGWYYTTDNPRYSKIKPDICFLNEDYAKNIAGFVKRF